jgi:single-stranded DNA-binding protein
LRYVSRRVKIITKGKQIFIEGELNIDSYMKDDERKTFTKVKVDKLEFQRGGTVANTDMKVKNEFKLEEFGNFEAEEVPF